MQALIIYLVVCMALPVASCSQDLKDREFFGGKVKEARYERKSENLRLLLNTKNDVLVPPDVVWIEEQGGLLFGQKEATEKSAEWLDDRWSFSGFFSIESASMQVRWFNSRKSLDEFLNQHVKSRDAKKGTLGPGVK